MLSSDGLGQSRGVPGAWGHGEMREQICMEKVGGIYVE